MAISEAYLEPVRAYAIESFCKKKLTNFNR